jgi:outer membrane protein assembly factor BamB
MLLLSLVLLAGASSAPAANWSFWRGPEQNGISRERDLPEKFTVPAKGKGENLIWAAPYGSITTPIVQDGQVYIINRVGEGVHLQERVMAFNADTGAVVWEHRFNVFLSDIVKDRLGFTHMVGDPETGNVYAHGTQGFLMCFSKKGDLLWRRSMTEEFGRVAGYGGRVTSPIVDEDKLIVGIVNGSWGEQTVGMTRFVAFDKKTGEILWWGPGGYRVADTYYSTPVVAVIGGQRLILSGGGDGCIHAFKVRTGEKVWSYKFGPAAVNCSPIVQGDRVWIGHGEENEGNTQGRVICLDAGKVVEGKPKLVWQVDGIKAKFAAPILLEGRLYVCDDAANLFCLAADTGKEIWQFSYGSNTKGSPTWADGKIYVSEVDSKFHILKPGDTECEELSSYRFRTTGVAPVELHGSTAIVNGRIYFTTTEQLICIGKKDHDAKTDKIPAGPREAPVATGAKATHIQIVPADVSLRPGESVTFKAYIYDENGHKLGEAKVEWEKAGIAPPVFPIGLTAPKAPAGAAPPPIAGELSATSGETTKLTVAKLPNGQFGRVLAKLDGLTAHARVRVAPALPYAPDFKKIPLGRIPGGWINAQAKFMIAEVDGAQVLRKRNDNPNILVARANSYLDLPDTKNYTIEADVYGTKVGSDLPEVGIGANRYSLLLIGNDQEIRLVTWDAQKRIEKKVPFAIKEKVWYRMKLTTDIKEGKGVIKGKVWERDAKEPAEWSVEIEDPIPNTEGSPLIYGFSQGVVDPKHPGNEIYYDNIKVTPNKK